MELEQIKAIITMMKENDLAEFSMEQDGLKIRIRRGPDGISQAVSVPAAPLPVAVPVAAAPTAAEPPPAPVAEGKFISSPAPDAPPYIEIGQAVEEETVVCIIEAMKVMNEIKAEVKGVITDVLLDNAKPVEFGQKLFAVRPK